LFIAFLLLKLPGKIRLIIKNPGDLFALYVLGYTCGRLWIEALRIDEAHHIFGIRLNVWVSMLVLLGAATYLLKSRAKAKKI
jgi:prolipoprotein diacylglyceryltransferase